MTYWTVPFTCGLRKEDPSVGGVMQKFAPFLKLYSEYVKNFDSAMETITYWLDKCPRFLQIVKDIQVSVMLLAVTVGLQPHHVQQLSHKYFLLV